MKKYASDDERVGFKGFFFVVHAVPLKNEMIHLTGDTKNTVTLGFYLHRSALLALFNVDVLHIFRFPVHKIKCF